MLIELNDNYLMLKLSRLLRNRAVLNVRGGGGWQRPDVPPTMNVPVKQQLTLDNIMFTFPDNSQPEYLLTQPEVYLGTPLQGLPTFAKLWSFFFGTAALIGFGLSFAFKLREVSPIEDEKEFNFIYKRMKDLIDNKTAAKIAASNPYGIEFPIESYPAQTGGKQVIPRGIVERKNSFDHYNKIRAEVNAYLSKKKQQARKQVQSGHSNHHQHH